MEMENASVVSYTSFSSQESKDVFMYSVTSKPIINFPNYSTSISVANQLSLPKNSGGFNMALTPSLSHLREVHRLSTLKKGMVLGDWGGGGC
jgi:hypothetical protein